VVPVKDVKRLYRKYEKDIYKYLYYLTGNKELANDLLQETFLQAFTSIHRFKGQSKVRTWLFQIAKFTYYSHVKKTKREKNALDELDCSEVEASPEQYYIKAERDRFLFDSIKNISEPYKQVVILKAFNDLSYREIGEVFEKSESWARVTFHRGKLKLLQMLKQGGMNNVSKL
jgi:RNA polymerase sigma-70 factor, ECF subfamily